MLKINQLSIDNVAGIVHANIIFDDSFNVLCGSNGVGKTTILECISHTFNVGHPSNILKRNSNSERGKVLVNFIDNDKTHSCNYEISNFEPTKGDVYVNQKANKDELSIINIKAGRTFSYRSVSSISKDRDVNRTSRAKTILDGASMDDFKSWFLNRYLYSPHDGALTENQMANLELAKKVFSILDDGYSFHKVSAHDHEIILKTPSGIIYFEYLSSGFKSCLSIVFMIIKEIEISFGGGGIKAGDFSGIILIDEPELHLHPSWQYKLREILTTIFPFAQFICATHSPYIVQSCDASEVITLSNKDGVVSILELPVSSMYGFKGWAVDEVLQYVMGMSDPRTDFYKKLVTDFYKSIDDGDEVLATRIFEKIDAALHPSNIDRKIFKMDLSILTGGGRGD